MAAHRSAALLGFAMDAQRYAAQSVRQLAQAAEALGGAAPANILPDHERVLQGIWSEHGSDVIPFLTLGSSETQSKSSLPSPLER